MSSLKELSESVAEWRIINDEYERTAGDVSQCEKLLTTTKEALARALARRTEWEVGLLKLVDGLNKK
jgi:hypothetical protein